MEIQIDRMGIGFGILWCGLGGKEMRKEELDMGYTELGEMKRENKRR